MSQLYENWSSCIFLRTDRGNYDACICECVCVCVCVCERAAGVCVCVSVPRVCVCLGDDVDHSNMHAPPPVAVPLPSPQTLQEVEVLVVGNKQCSCSYGEGEITDNMICAGVPSGGKGSCQVGNHFIAFYCLVWHKSAEYRTHIFVFSMSALANPRCR